ncbi:hypothetical protein GGTG_08663 [Gaeumannomyces tritici R3-111a-1]|uniref:von Willebrand domain-containing protein n=1 Tax=Gaeumannomyces tritici (strain R3-111a-1) TaxID=644352 RepID=J3P574_GAET3|nr:hypothetical protein GGTG_08663 [Gaeumannomyces tritici R3-111a-1]EJT74825.1 hypothetical protein GGTG_08663 [Gaeumannomyces tritici R3-111a-1]
MDYHFPTGIFWDPREPPPPEVHEHIDHDKGLARPGGGLSKSQSVKRKEHKLLNNLAVTIPAAEPGAPALCVLVPLSIAIKARVVQDVAKITVTQLYFNKSERPIEQGGYTFPLPNGCTVTAFRCRVGKKKTLRGHVKPKEQAKEAFSDAVKRRVTAGLMEEATSEIFTASLGNIPANTKIKVEFSFVMQLKRRFAGAGASSRSTTTLTIPTSIAPRYGDAPPSSQLGLASTDVARGLSVEVEIDSCEMVANVSSPTHAVTVERGYSRGRAQTWVELTGGKTAQAEAGSARSVLARLSSERTDLGGDFVLDIETERGPGEEDSPQAVLEIHPTIEHQAAAMITIPPKLLLTSAGDARSSAHGLGEVVFLADRSGSMSDKMLSLKSAMQFFLRGIPLGRKFNVWCFGSNFISLWPKSIDYTEESLAMALGFVSDSFKSDMGGTELLHAIEAIVAARDKSTYLDVIVLTDGEVWRQDETLDFIRDARRQSGDMVRLFALGVGDAVSHALVEGIATAGGGYSEIVPARTRDGWEDRVVAMTHAALTSHWGSVEIEIQPDPVESEASVGAAALPSVLQSPTHLGAINLYQKGRIFLLFNSLSEPTKPRHIVLKITSGPADAIERVHIPLTIAGAKDDAIHTLATKSVLEDMRNQPPIHGYGDGGMTPGGDRTLGEALACRFSITSRWTSFFLSEENGDEIIDDPDLGETVLSPSGGVKAAIETRRRTAFAPSSAGGGTSSSAFLTRLRASLTLSGHGDKSMGHLTGDFPRTLLENAGRGSFEALLQHEPELPRPTGNHTTVITYSDGGGGDGSFSIGTSHEGIIKRPMAGRAPLRRSNSGATARCVPNDFMVPLGRAMPVRDGSRQFVRDLLRFQHFDGSFNFIGGWDELETALGCRYHGSVARLRQACGDGERTATAPATILGIPAKVAYALMVVELLQRDFMEFESLWRLMIMKARSFAEKQVPDEEVREGFVRTWLGLLAAKEGSRGREPAKQEVHTVPAEDI